MALTHRAPPHQTDKLVWLWLPCHSQQDFSERVVGNPAILSGGGEGMLTLTGRVE